MVKHLKVSLHDDVYLEIDHKQPSEEAIMESPKQWKKHLKNFKL